MANTPYDLENIMNQNRLLTEEIRRRVDQLSAINSVATMVSQSLDLNATLESALDSVLQVIPVEAAGISMIDEEAGELVMRAQRGWKHDFVTNPMRIKLGEGLSGAVMAQDKVVVTGDITDDPRIIYMDFFKEKVQAMVMAPMHARGRIIGIVSVMSYSPYTFTAEQTQVLQAIADQLGVALDNASLFEETRARQRRLSAVIDSTADAIIAIDKRGLINLVNSATETLFEIPARQLQGKRLYESGLHTRLLEGARRVMEDESQSVAFFELTLDNGRYLSVAASPVQSPEGLPNTFDLGGWVLVMQDITHLREAEKNRIRFIQAAAHDLRNPIGSAMSALDLLRLYHHRQNRDIDPSKMVELAMMSIDRMRDLIDDLLDLERVQSGVSLDMAPVDVRDLLERVMLETQPSIQHKEQHFHLEVADFNVMVYGDTRWLSRALVNLLSNACKYTPEGGDITLRAMHNPAEQELVIEVEDDGIGIAASNRNRIFETFFRESRVRDQVPGTGLGLAIVKSVIEQHGGRVYVKSKEGQGSTFGITLPIVSENERE